MTYQLISFQLCPYVQRSVITLAEKNVPYEVQYIDLANKPDWFLEISPFGKVPVLKVDDAVLFESAVINEYIDDTTDGSLMPSDPLLKAQNRAWIEFASSLGMETYKLMTGGTEQESQSAAKTAREKLNRIESQIKGPYWNGADFSLVDTAIAPMLQRLSWCNDIAPELGIFDETPKVKAYTEALLARPSVQASLPPDIVELYHAYLSGKGSPTRNVDPSWLGTRLAA